MLKVIFVGQLHVCESGGVPSCGPVVINVDCWTEEETSNDVSIFSVPACCTRCKRQDGK